MSKVSLRFKFTSKSTSKSRALASTGVPRYAPES